MDVEIRERSPRAFHPDFLEQPPPLHGQPGWDQGPERRIDDRALVRSLAWLGLGLGLAAIAAAAVVAARRLAEGHTVAGRRIP